MQHLRQCHGVLGTMQMIEYHWHKSTATLHSIFPHNHGLKQKHKSEIRSHCGTMQHIRHMRLFESPNQKEATGPSFFLFCHIPLITDWKIMKLLASVIRLLVQCATICRIQIGTATGSCLNTGDYFPRKCLSGRARLSVVVASNFAYKRVFASWKY